MSTIRLLTSAFLVFVWTVFSATPTAAQQANAPARRPIPGQYVVILAPQQAAAVVNVANAVAQTHNAQVVHVYRYALQGMTVQMTPAAAAAMAADARVESVVQDEEATLHQGPSLTAAAASRSATPDLMASLDATQTGATWGLDRIDQRDLPLSTTYNYNFTGNGVHAYIIDTGLRATHTEFTGRVGNGADFGGLGMGDCNGHGTHVAGTVGGTVYGVAKQVTIHPVRVFQCGNTTPFSTLIAGVDWVTANHVKPAVANMSFGGGVFAAMDTAVVNMINAGVTAVISAGNSNADACNFSPARVPQAITVAATTITDSRDTSYSNFGTCVDIFAPGTDITSAWIDNDTDTNTIDGTSMASPHVAGVAALILSQLGNQAPANVTTAIINIASLNKVLNPGAGSPNRLLYSLNNVRGAITSPAPNSVLTSSNATFTWTPGQNALQYWLYVGTGGVGSANIWNQDQGLGTTRAVTGITTGIIYVRLWTRFASGWEFNDYLYYRGAEITTPAPGSNLGATATFIWSNATGAAQYWLYVGTTGAGSSNVWNQDQGTALSRLVTGIPSAATIYVRIWTRFAAIGWVFRDFTYTATQTKAVITSPAPGSILPGASASFIWTPGTHALQYWLYVGTAGVGSANIWNQDQGTTTSRFVSGLPVTGGTVYVRLWTLFASGWQFNDYTYIAVQKAVITSPVPGSTFTSSTPTLVWTTGVGATQYYLYVGTTGVGSANLLNQSQGTATSKVLSGIPLTGGTIYVRLWTLFPSGWEFNDYIYTAASTVRAVLTSPTPGSVLPGATVTFGWTPGTGSLAYWLFVGSSPGGTDILNLSLGLAPGRTVTGIPTDGRRIYVRLWSLTATGWFYTDYSFTASGTQRARLATPAEESVLAGTTATFTWSAGTAATQYWLYVGTTPGALDLWSQNMGTTLTATVSGLPADRRPIYVRIWSLLAGGWVSNDYVFRAYDGGATRGRIVSPSEEMTLVGTSTTFTWAAGSGATQYWLYVGTTRGGLNLFSQNMGVLTSATVPGLPTTGVPIYVRLWSLVGGVWQSNDYDYTAAP